MSEPTTAVAKQEKKSLTIRSQLEGSAFKDAVAKALPTHLPADRFIRIALTAITRTPKLADCDQASFFNALLSLSQFGLEPDGRRAHLIPFENRKRGVTECQLIIDYKGLVELVMRSGAVSNLHADVVCENDEFEYDRGELKRHKINFRKPRGEVYAVYALCRFKDGSEKAEVMSRDDVEAIRARSRAGQSGPWVTDWSEMAKKTCFKRLSKWLALSPEYRDALEVDDSDHEEQRFQTAKVVIGAPQTPFEIAAAAQPVTKPTNLEDDKAEAAAGLAPEQQDDKKSTATVVPPAGTETKTAEPVKEAAKTEPATATATTGAGTASAASAPNLEEDLKALTTLLDACGKDEDTFLRFLKATRTHSTPLASARELGECSPKKLHGIVTNWEPIRKNLVDFK